MKKNLFTVSALILFFGFFPLFFSCSKQKEYHLYDVVLSDGSVLNVSDYQSYSGKAKPMAVIFSLTGASSEEKVRVIGVGLYGEPDGGIAFTEDGSFGDNTNFIFNQSAVLEQEMDFATLKFTNSGFVGALDGRKSFDNVSRRDKNARKKIHSIYPAFSFAEEYGKNFSYKRYKDGWYLPSIAELYELFINIDEVNGVIELLGGDKIQNETWSSSQVYKHRDGQYLLDMNTGEVQISFKDIKAHVRSVYCFKD